MASVLIIWQDVPETTYTIERHIEDDVELQAVLDCHNQYINGNAEGEQYDFMMDYFYEDQGNGEFKFKSCEVGQPLRNVKYDYVIFTGIYL